MTYLIIDLEATCCDRRSIPRRETEIIEFGAVAVERSLPFEALGEFQSFVRPVRHPLLTPFCTRLTTITQSDVDAAPGFVEVAAALKRWVFSFPEPVFCSWGDYDRRQLRQDCDRHGVPYFMPRHHVNIKKRFAAEQLLPRPLGMAGALRRAGLPLEGTHHRGIDDVRNMRRLMPFIFGDLRLSSGSASRSPATASTLRHDENPISEIKRS